VSEIGGKIHYNPTGNQFISFSHTCLILPLPHSKIDVTSIFFRWHSFESTAATCISKCKKTVMP